MLPGSCYQCHLVTQTDGATLHIATTSIGISLDFLPVAVPERDDSDNVQSGNVTNEVFQSGNVTSEVFQSGNVTSEVFQSGNVTSEEFQSGNVTSEEFQSGNVTNGNLKLHDMDKEISV